MRHSDGVGSGAGGLDDRNSSINTGHNPGRISRDIAREGTHERTLGNDIDENISSSTSSTSKFPQFCQSQNSTSGEQGPLLPVIAKTPSVTEITEMTQRKVALASLKRGNNSADAESQVLADLREQQLTVEEEEEESDESESTEQHILTAGANHLKSDRRISSPNRAPPGVSDCLQTKAGDAGVHE